ncbi:MAG: ABC transporter permease [Halanaerobiales bacterium]
MGFLIKLAFKNLFRHKLRTFVSIIAIAFAIMIVIFARGYVVGMIDSLYRDHVQYNSGHIKIITPEYRQEERMMPLIYPVDGFEDGSDASLNQMMSSLQGIENVEMLVPRLKFGAMVSTEDELVTMTGWGVIPEKELEFTNIEDYIVEGKMVEEGQMEIVIGTDLLEKINAGVGDKVTIIYNTSFGSMKGATFKIVGRIESGLQLLNKVVFYLPLDQAQRLLYMNGQATELLLLTPARNMVSPVLTEVKELFADRGASEKYLALSYMDTSDLLPFMDMAKTIYNTIYIFLVLLACIVVVNTMIMIVNERTKEIGTMSAMGMDSGGILGLFIIEGSILGVIGSALGTIVGSFINSYLAEVGMNFESATAGFSSDLTFNSMIYPVSSVGNSVFAFILGVVIVTIACIIPARRAAKLEPTEAIKEA